MIELWVIRWSGEVTLPSGACGVMASFTGPREQAEAYAWRIAEENGVTVEVIA